jgi:hypothetical protein
MAVMAKRLSLFFPKGFNEDNRRYHEPLHRTDRLRTQWECWKLVSASGDSVHRSTILVRISAYLAKTSIYGAHYLQQVMSPARNRYLTRRVTAWEMAKC